MWSSSRRRGNLARNPHDIGMTDLAAWDRFEHDNPNTFSGMYQFWLQKPA